MDATYISESVERAEFLESSTKKYGVPVLMSDAFYNLLDHTNKYRCRKIDQLLIFSEEDDSLSTRDIMEHGEKMELYVSVYVHHVDCFIFDTIRMGSHHAACLLLFFLL